MGHVRKIGDAYYIEFFARGLMYSQLAGTDEATAERMLEDIERRISSGEALTVVRNISIKVFFQQFLIYATAEYSTISLKRFNALITHFQDFLSSGYSSVCELSQITPAIIEDYKAAWINRTTHHKINLSILLLREIMEYGIKTGFINDNPTLHVSLLPWRRRTFKKTFRYELAKDLLARSIATGRVVKLLKFDDIGRIIYFSNLIPLKREEMYN